MASVLLLLLFAGCGKEPDPASRPSAGYLELIRCYEEGRVFTSAELTTTICRLRFADGSSLVVPVTDCRIYDCRETAPAEVSTKDGWWTVGGIVYGIRCDSSLSRVDSLPVYAYFDNTTLYLYISNGECLIFPAEEPAPAEKTIESLQKIPMVHIYTDGGALIWDKVNYVRATITVLDPERNCSDVEEFTATMGIRGRGNSTWGWRKKPYRIKLDEKASLLGMPADKDWCLLANYADKSLLRNTVAMELSRICGFSWTPCLRHVEVFLNGCYQGVYDLCEHKEVSKHKVNITVAAETDIQGEALTGGYYLEMEQNMDEASCWWTSMGVPMMFKDPEFPAPEQAAYMKDYVNRFESALWNGGYEEYIDVDSFVNYYILQELTKNVDGNFRKSTFIAKDRGARMVLCHVWDFDLTMGVCGYFPWDVGNGPENFWIRDFASNCTRDVGWYSRLFSDPVFVDAVKERWNALMPELETIPDFIDREALILDKAQRNNFSVWDIGGSDHDLDWVMYTPKGSYGEEINYLREFYASRLRWLDGEINKF